jgi:excisionase family DNA binding protein
MNAASVLRVAGDLLHQADLVRDAVPEVAAALEADSVQLIETVPAVSVAEAADLLGQSRPTVYEWIKAGYLLSEEARTHGLSVSPSSLVKLMAVLGQWDDDGRPGRPSRLLRRWVGGELDLRKRRREFAAKRKDGTIGLRPPRRSAQEAVLA